MSKAVVSALRALFAPLGYPRPVEMRALFETRRARLGRWMVSKKSDWKKVAAWVDQMEAHNPKGIYVVMNPIRVQDGEQSGGTTDADIASRQWLLVDIDSVRPSGQSATNKELRAALVTVKAIRQWLLAQGWPEPFVAMSGNGGHLMWRLDLDADEAGTEAVRRVLDVLAVKFTSDVAVVDSTVYNLSRIWRLYGTTARKGQQTEERPWRQATLVKAGSDEAVTLEQMEEVAGLFTGDKSENKAEIAKLQTWLHKHYNLGAPIPYSGRQGTGVRWIFPICPWDETHRDRAAYLIRFDTGHLAAGCLHKNCPGHGGGWTGLQAVSPEPLPGVSNPPRVGPSTAAAPGLTDLGNAKRLVNLYGESLRYVPEWGHWLEFDGMRWQPDNTGIILQRASAVARTLFAEAAMTTDADEAKRIRKFAIRCESLSMLSNMEKLARAEPGVSVPVVKLDDDGWLLNCQNGTLDLRDGTLLPSDRKRLITKLAPISFDADAECPTWDAFLDRIFDGDQELIEFIHRALGYCLTGSVREQVMFFCHGIGANGKTTFLRTIQSILGDYAIQTDASLLMSSPGEKHPTGLADLLKVRFAAASETDRGRHFSEALVKQITGDDIMVARKMRQDFFRFEPTHKLWLAANYKPIIKGNDIGIWRRIIYVPFEVTIPKEERDKQLIEKLKAESQGILAKVVRGCLNWQSQGLNPPAKVLDKTAAYQEEMDLLREFFEECCKMGDNALVPRSQLYDAYRDWCEDRYDKPVKFTYFNRLVEERGYELVVRTTSGGSTVKLWRGLALGRGSEARVIEIDFA